MPRGLTAQQLPSVSTKEILPHLSMPLSDSMLVIVVSMLLKSTLFGKRHRKVLRDNIHSAICAPGRSQTHIWTDVRGDPVRAHKNAPQHLIRCCCQQIRQTPRLCELLLSRKRNNRVYLPRKVNNRRTQYGGDVVRNQVSEIPAWACSCCTEEGRSTYAEIVSQDCYVLSVARKVYTPTGDEQQAIRRNGSGVSNRMHVPKNHKSRRMLLYPVIRVRAIVLPWMLLLPLAVVSRKRPALGDVSPNRQCVAFSLMEEAPASSRYCSMRTCKRHKSGLIS